MLGTKIDNIHPESSVLPEYLNPGKNFIPGEDILHALSVSKKPDRKQVDDILKKSLAIENLTPDETALLLNVEDPELRRAMEETAFAVKKKVYDNRIVTFAPLYLGNHCVNNCLYCGFKSSNMEAKRKVLSKKEILDEVAVLAGEIGHKRLIVVSGEHPCHDLDYLIKSIEAIYSVKMPVKGRTLGIHRVNVNAPSMGIAELKKLHKVGIGTYQVFQETYHRPTYERVHPAGTPKGDYLSRLYTMHRAMEAGIDDVGIGVLFGLYDWKFEVMGLVYHALELEKQFGIGPHTVSFPRLEPALNLSYDLFSRYRVSDDAFKKIITVIRLAIPYTGMIITARESRNIRQASIACGVTQMDASPCIAIGGYKTAFEEQDQDKEKQQFILGDTRTLDTVIRELADLGFITSFCTAGYRCGRTGKNIMECLRKGVEKNFCKCNAIITFKEWLDDFATAETRRIGEKLLAREINELKNESPLIFKTFEDYYKKTQAGERDLYL